MKGMSNAEGITFADLIDFVDNNRRTLDGSVPIRLHTNFDETNNQLRDILIEHNIEYDNIDCIRMYNYI